MTPPPASEERELRFEFTGDAGEYFRIWIVNTLLSILTLGIYSAWAKVRTRQYFYAHTKLDGSSFEYLANPVKVLIGRVIAVLALGLLLGSQYYSLPLYLVVLGLFVLATPWVLVKALAFKAHNSAYRNIRFAFTGGPGEAFGRYLGMLVVYVATCGLGLPYAQWNMTSFIVTRHLFGDLRPEWVTKPGQYFRVYLLALFITLPVYVLIGAMIFASAEAGQSPGELQSAMVAPVIAVYAFLLAAFINARIANLVYGGIRLGEHRLSCQQRGRDILWLYSSNLVAIVCTLGLAIPWAKVRLAKYRAARLGNTARSLYFPDGAKCESDDHECLDDLERRAGRGGLLRFVHALETRRGYVLFAAALLIATLVAGAKWGVPLAAERAAAGMPSEMAYDLGRGTLEVLDSSLLRPSELPEAVRARLEAQFSAWPRNIRGCR